MLSRSLCGLTRNLRFNFGETILMQKREKEAKIAQKIKAQL